MVRPEAASGVVSLDGEGTYQRLLTAAMDLFIERGYEGTTMSQLASRAGITTPALYWHFKSKEDLYFTVVRSGYAEFQEWLLARSVGDSVEQRFRRFIRVFVKMQLDDPRVTYGYAQLLEALPDDKRDEVLALEDTTKERLRTILRDGSAAGTFQFDDLEATAAALMSMCEYVFTWYKPNGRLSVDEVAELFVKLARRLVGAD